MGIGYLVSTMNGFDSSLMGAINAMKPYQDTFGLSGEGSSAGIIFIIYNLGQIAAFPFCGFLADGYGRRLCIFVGCALVLVGTAVQATAHSMDHFIGGRFILGFGASIASAAGPAYTVELAHPAYRGTMAGMYNNFWWLGNILAGWTTYGTNKNFGNSWAWRLPTIVQCFIPGLVLCCIMFLPETPRYVHSVVFTLKGTDSFTDGYLPKTDVRRLFRSWPSTTATAMETTLSSSSNCAKLPRTSLLHVTITLGGTSVSFTTRRQLDTG